MYSTLNRYLYMIYIHSVCYTLLLAGPASSVGCASAWYADGRGFGPPVRQHSFVEIGHEIIYTAIFPLPLIQVGPQLLAKVCALSTG